MTIIVRQLYLWCQTFKGKSMTKKQTPKAHLTLEQKSQIETPQAVEPANLNAPTRQTNSKKSQTTVKWSLVTQIETKSMVSKAAKKAGKGLFEWSEEKLREAAVAELTSKPEPPARAEDLVKDIVEQFAEKFQASQEAATKAQNDLLEKQGEQIAELKKAIQDQPRSLKEIIFGKKS